MSNDGLAYLIGTLVAISAIAFTIWYDPVMRRELTVEEISAADACVRERLNQAASSEGERDRTSPLLKRDLENAVRDCERAGRLERQRTALSEPTQPLN